MSPSLAVTGDACLPVLGTVDSPASGTLEVATVTRGEIALPVLELPLKTSKEPGVKSWCRAECSTNAREGDTSEYATKDDDTLLRGDNH